MMNSTELVVYMQGWWTHLKVSENRKKNASWAQCPKTDLKKGSYLDQRLPQHESLYPIGFK